MGREIGVGIKVLRLKKYYVFQSEVLSSSSKKRGEYKQSKDGVRVVLKTEHGGMGSKWLKNRVCAYFVHGPLVKFLNFH